MITEASISLTRDGAVLFTIPESGMDVSKDTSVQIESGKIYIAQNDKTYATIPVDNKNLLMSIARSDDINIVEVGNDFFAFHEHVTLER